MNLDSHLFKNPEISIEQLKNIVLAYIKKYDVSSNSWISGKAGLENSSNVFNPIMTVNSTQKPKEPSINYPGDDRTKKPFERETENTNPVAMQQMGWQSILNSFKQYTESLN